MPITRSTSSLDHACDSRRAPQQPSTQATSFNLPLTERGMGEARTWLESRHLGRSPEGAHALACFARLPARAADTVLRDADKLAQVSVTLAHRFFVGAVSLQTERPDRYAWWSRLITDALATEAGGRSLVQALLEPEPVQLASLPPLVSLAWGEQTLRLAASSGRLGATYARAFAARIVPWATRDAHLESRLRAWAGAITRTAAASPWRGELLTSPGRTSSKSRDAALPGD